MGLWILLNVIKRAGLKPSEWAELLSSISSGLSNEVEVMWTSWFPSGRTGFSTLTGKTLSE